MVELEEIFNLQVGECYLTDVIMTCHYVLALPLSALLVPTCAFSMCFELVQMTLAQETTCWLSVLFCFVF